MCSSDLSWSVLDHDRTPKLGYGALRDACRSVLPMVDPRTGAVHVVSEARTPIPDAAVTVRVDGREHRFAGEVAPGAVTYVGTVGGLTGATSAEVVLDHPGGSIRNGYDLVLTWLRIVSG